MATIDIGPGAINRSFFIGWANTTIVSPDNPANDSGSLDSFEIYANTTISNCKIGTFYGSSTSWTNRDYETIGTVNTGSKQTFTGKDCDVSSDDLLGLRYTSGQLEAGTTSSLLAYNGDAFGAGSKTYTSYANNIGSFYATGATAAAGNPYYYYLNQ